MVFVALPESDPRRKDRALQQHLDVAHLARQLAAEKAEGNSSHRNGSMGDPTTDGFHGKSHEKPWMMTTGG